jgi:hypothetical protein
MAGNVRKDFSGNQYQENSKDDGIGKVEAGWCGVEGALAIYAFRGTNGYSDDADIQKYRSSGKLSAVLHISPGARCVKRDGDRLIIPAA